jgi:hypothetical protein
VGSSGDSLICLIGGIAMKRNKNGNKDLSVKVEPRADAALLYDDYIDASLSQISVTNLEVRGLAREFIGEELRKLCPYGERCDNNGPCEMHSCRYAKVIFEHCLIKAHTDFDYQLRSFLEMYVRRLYEQTPFIVDYQIRNTVENSQPDEKNENYDE